MAWRGGHVASNNQGARTGLLFNKISGCSSSHGPVAQLSLSLSTMSVDVPYKNISVADTWR